MKEHSKSVKGFVKATTPRLHDCAVEGQSSEATVQEIRLLRELKPENVKRVCDSMCLSRSRSEVSEHDKVAPTKERSSSWQHSAAVAA